MDSIIILFYVSFGLFALFIVFKIFEGRAGNGPLKKLSGIADPLIARVEAAGARKYGNMKVALPRYFKIAGLVLQYFALKIIEGGHQVLHAISQIVKGRVLSTRRGGTSSFFLKDIEQHKNRLAR